MSDAKRKLTNLHVQFISLVGKPANGKDVILKSADGATVPGNVTRFELKKADSKLMRVYGIVYAPDEVDSHGDTTDAETIRRAADEFMREGRTENIDVDHSYIEDTAYLAESWIVRKGDPLFPNETEGAWAVGIQITDVALWKRFDNGELTGLSLAGVAQAKETKPDEHTTYTEKEKGLADRILRLLTKKITPEETKMEKDEIVALVTSEVAKAVADLKPAKEVEKAAAGMTTEQIEKHVNEAVNAALGDRLTDAVSEAVAKATAKGNTETGGQPADDKESFL